MSGDLSLFAVNPKVALLKEQPWLLEFISSSNLPEAPLKTVGVPEVHPKKLEISVNEFRSNVLPELLTNIRLETLMLDSSLTPAEGKAAPVFIFMTPSAEVPLGYVRRSPVTL